MNDQTLLSQYVTTRDAKSFEELTSRYSRLVRGVCIRILGNSHDAEEVAQECFFELARNAGSVHTSLGGWLHQTATSRSLNVLRSRARRKVRERAFGLEVESVSPEIDPTVPDLQRLIQGALTELPDDLRVPVVMHYVDGRSQRDVAEQLGVNQSTISRRMRDALRQLRDKMTRAGYAATAPALVVWIQDHAAAAHSEKTLTEAAVSGVAGKVAGGVSLASSLKLTATALLPILGFLLWNGWVSFLIAIGVAIYVVRYRPRWVIEVMSSFGSPDPYQHFSGCHPWSGMTAIPGSWRSETQSALLWTAAFSGLAWVFASSTRQPPWGIVALGATLAIACFLHLLRIIFGVMRETGSQSGTRIVIPSGFDPAEVRVMGSPTSFGSWTWFDAVQLISIGLAGVAIPAEIVLHAQGKFLWPALTLSATIGAVMLTRGIQLGHQLISSRRHGVRATLESRPSEMTTSRGTRTIVAIGTLIVGTLSVWIFWNPSAVRSLSLSLAAVQTSMLGWIIYRIAAIRVNSVPRVWSRLIIALLAGCFVLNSGMCLAHWMN